MFHVKHLQKIEVTDVQFEIVSMVTILFLIGIAAVLLILLEYLKIRPQDCAIIGLLLCLSCIYLEMPHTSYFTTYMFWPGAVLVLMGVFKNRSK